MNVVRYFVLSAAFLIVAATASHAAELPLRDAQFVQRLRAGGYVLVMRHTQAPKTLPSATEAEPDNPDHERQLDATGKASARELGLALRSLHITIGPIYSSPSFRARQTIRLAELGMIKAVAELAESAQGMHATAGQSQTAWLRQAVAQPPPAGSNTLIVTHSPNIIATFGHDVADIKPGEMMIFRRGSDGRAGIVRRITVDQWMALAHP